MKINAAALALLGLLALPLAHAGVPYQDTPGIDRLQAEISARIEQGIRTGHITHGEARRLYQRERELRWREMQFKRDGHASHEERRALRHDLHALQAEVEDKMANRRRIHREPDPMADIFRDRQRIHARISRAVATGEITPGEARRLSRQEDQLHALQGEIGRDGILTRGERRQWQQQLEELDARLERFASNRNDGRY